jgi:hypothetical protein
MGRLIEWGHIAIEVEGRRWWLDRLRLCLLGVINQKGSRCGVEIGVFYTCELREKYDKGRFVYH